MLKWLKNVKKEKKEKGIKRSDASDIKRRLKHIETILSSLQKSLLSLENRSLIVTKAVPEVAASVNDLNDQVEHLIAGGAPPIPEPVETPTKSKKRRTKKKKK